MSLRPAIRRALGRPVQGSTSPRIRSGFTPADAPGLRGWWRSRAGVFKTGPSAAGDGETPLTWVDVVNGLTLTRTAASSAAVLDIDGAPRSKPAIISTGAAFSRVFSPTLSSPWVAAVCRLDWAGAASLIVDSSATARFYCSRYSITQLSIASGVVNNDNKIVDGEWGLLILDWGSSGAFNWSGQVEKIFNTGTNANANFVWGRDYNGATPTNNRLAELIVGDGTLDRATRINLRAWASREYGFSFPSDKEFIDTFTRADQGPTIGTSDSGHTWPTLAADTRILSNTLTYISPWTTLYAPVPINFAPKTAIVNFTTRAGGGASTNTAWYYLIGLAPGDYDPCFHFSATNVGWVIQEFEAAAVVNVHLVSGKNYGGAGVFRLDFDFAGGTVTVTDPEGTVTVVDWDNSGVPARNLASYETQFVFMELLGSGSTNTLIYQFDRLELRA